MKFDWSINIGELIAAAVLFVSLITAHMQNIRKLQEIETRLTLIYDWWVHNVVNRERQD